MCIVLLTSYDIANNMRLFRIPSCGIVAAISHNSGTTRCRGIEELFIGAFFEAYYF